MLYETANRVYNATIRHRLPAKIGLYGDDVYARGPRLLDRTDELPHYKEGTRRAFDEQLHDGDRVVIIGGGHGVSTVRAARAVGEDGQVITFEASRTQVPAIEETLRLNQIDGKVDVRAQLVAEGREVYGPATGDVIAPDELPDCDVLHMDCEGAEQAVLAGLAIRPRCITVETHPQHGAPTARTRTLLEGLGYAVVDEFHQTLDVESTDLLLVARLVD